MEQAEADDGKFVVNYLEGRASRSARGKGKGGVGGQAQLCREGAVPSCPPGGSRGCLRGGPIRRPQSWEVKGFQTHQGVRFLGGDTGTPQGQESQQALPPTTNPTEAPVTSSLTPFSPATGPQASRDAGVTAPQIPRPPQERQGLTPQQCTGPVTPTLRAFAGGDGRTSPVGPTGPTGLKQAWPPASQQGPTLGSSSSPPGSHRMHACS